MYRDRKDLLWLPLWSAGIFLAHPLVVLATRTIDSGEFGYQMLFKMLS